MTTDPDFADPGGIADALAKIPPLRDPELNFHINGALTRLRLLASGKCDPKLAEAVKRGAQEHLTWLAKKLGPGLGRPRP